MTKSQKAEKTSLTEAHKDWRERMATTQSKAVDDVVSLLAVLKRESEELAAR